MKVANVVDRFSKKKTHLSNFFEIRPVGAELLHADRRTDMNLIVAFRSFANAPNKNQTHFILDQISDQWLPREFIS